jgi:hypothetical protein
VKNTCDGISSGYAWAGDTGSWINFAPDHATVPAHIDTTTGQILGQIWVSGINGGWYDLSSSDGTYGGLYTTWRPSASCKNVVTTQSSGSSPSLLVKHIVQGRKRSADRFHGFGKRVRCRCRRFSFSRLSKWKYNNPCNKYRKNVRSKSKYFYWIQYCFFRRL